METKFTAIRPLPGYEGKYAVSQDGRVRSLKRTVMRSNGVPMTVRGRWLKPILREDGYLVVTLHDDDEEERKVRVHQAVAAAWLPAPASDQLEINHRDGNKTNNAPMNLEWCTSSENKRHAVELGLTRYHTSARRAAQRDSALPKRKLDADQVAAIREQLTAGGVSMRAIAKQFGVADLTIRRIASGETYQPQPEIS